MKRGRFGHRYYVYDGYGDLFRLFDSDIVSHYFTSLDRAYKALAFAKDSARKQLELDKQERERKKRHTIYKEN